MQFLAILWPILLGTLFTTVQGETKNSKRDNGQTNISQFVSTRNGQFIVNGSEFKFVGVNAPWLPTLITKEDIKNTLCNMSEAGIKVVRTWGFNDVTEIPENKNQTWFQLINKNGTVMINNGTNGLQKLDFVLEAAHECNMLVILSLTNNWNPVANSSTNDTRPRNTLSNDFGGMDTYVRQFGGCKHDEFYTNQTLINAFENYTTQIVTRYVNNPTVFSWEIANDARCNSSVAASPSCTPQTVTAWHSTIAQHIKTIDSNHIVSSGNQGFLCIGCPKLFPLRPTPPAPQVSAVPGQRRATKPQLLTKRKLIMRREERRRKNRALAGGEASGVRVRGRWVASRTRRQEENEMGSAFDGSAGVDTEDILNIPEIGYSSFQLFPDQNTYTNGAADSGLSGFQSVLQEGLDWIQIQAELSATFGKPIALTAFGLVSQEHAPDFVPFNTTVAPFAADSTASTTSNQTSNSTFGVTNSERTQAYSAWLDGKSHFEFMRTGVSTVLLAGISSGLAGIMQYQWGVSNVTAAAGTSFSPNENSTSSSPDETGTSSSPDDGYSIIDSNTEDTESVISAASQQIAAD
ncbi:glycoside hydrolase family 5 protein [Desarmillaria tabescens]|uniref:mannan endo-1,4-beta-mannosidase n=1 Tax=Armillaria tabescens TaxID=1929756 RepID=A0AA39N6C0_ARMTA|nr:glycoside hydrolase family 5 protein [Desarmillaria tabescens]KAK0459721.1 glycoside hydrolase family 5 protein [Desarmillaria tabescens]